MRRARVIGVAGAAGRVRAPTQQRLAALGVDARQVRTPADLDRVDALVMPGGESTTMSKLLDDERAVRRRSAERIDDGMPVFGTCAGMILLRHRGARRPARPAQLRRHRHHRAPQRLRPPARQLRGRPRRRRPRRPVPRACSSGRRCVESGRRRRRGARRATRACPCSLRHGQLYGGSVPSRADRRRSAARRCSSTRSLPIQQTGARHVRPFQVGNDQAQEGRRRQGARQAVQQARPPARGGRPRRRRRPRRQPDAAHRGAEGQGRRR